MNFVMEMQSFTRSFLPFADTKGYDKLIISYLKKDEKLKKYYEFEPAIDGIRSRIAQGDSHFLDRTVLSDALIRQYKDGGIDNIPDKVLSNIADLRKSNAFTITTGHQLNLFGGPLYVLYKIVSVIKISFRLQKEFPDYRFVPVFWMASEDHDIDEISSVNLFGNKISWNTEWKGRAGKMPLTGIAEVIEDVQNLFGNSIHGESLRKTINESYRESSNLGEATRKWINSLFGNYGLVIIEGDDASLKRQVVDIFKDEVTNNSSSELIDKTRSELEKLFHAQVRPREINLFYARDDFRERLIKKGSAFEVLNTTYSFSYEELLSEIDAHPERFSPNVVMRPVYQEAILPNIAYIGGPAEVAYWLELKSLFHHYQTHMPCLFLRSCALVLEDSMIKKMKKFSINLEDIFLSADEIIRSFIERTETKELSFAEPMRIISEEFEKIARQISSFDPTLKPSVDAEHHKFLTSLRQLEDKIIRSQKKKNDTEITQIRSIKERLFPGGNFQEREVSYLTFLLKWGDKFIDRLLEHFDPFEQQFTILKENAQK